MTARQIVLTAAALLVVAATASGQARPRTAHKLSCKRVHDAVWAGHTIEQLTAEFDTDAQHIMKCLQARKGKKSVSQADKKGAKKGKQAAPAAKPGKKK